jgi:hypothetical protein
MRYALLMAAMSLALSACATGTPNQLTQEDTQRRAAQREAEQANRLKSEEGRYNQASEKVNRAFEALAFCIRRQAISLALTPEPTETLSHAAFAGCTLLHGAHRKAVMDAPFFTNDQAANHINVSDGKLRDMAIALIIEQRATPRDSTPSLSSPDRGI